MIIGIKSGKNPPVAVSHNISDHSLQFIRQESYRCITISGCLIHHQIQVFTLCRIIFALILLFQLVKGHGLFCIPGRHIRIYSTIIFVYQIYIYICIVILLLYTRCLVYQIVYLTCCLQQIIIIIGKQIQLIIFTCILSQRYTVDIFDKFLLNINSVCIYYVRFIIITFHLIRIICFRMSVVTGTSITCVKPATDIRRFYIHRFRNIGICGRFRCRNSCSFRTGVRSLIFAGISFITFFICIIHIFMFCLCQPAKDRIAIRIVKCIQIGQFIFQILVFVLCIYTIIQVRYI